MYSRFIKSRTRRAFADLSAGRVDEHIERFHDDAVLRIDRDGDVLLFRGKDEIHGAMRREFAEPGSHDFAVDEVSVSGWPHDTRVFVLWTDRPAATDGVRRGMNMIRIKWGRVMREFLFVGALETEVSHA